MSLGGPLGVTAALGGCRRGPCAPHVAVTPRKGIPALSRGVPVMLGGDPWCPSEDFALFWGGERLFFPREKLQGNLKLNCMKVYQGKVIWRCSGSFHDFDSPPTHFCFPLLACYIRGHQALTSERLSIAQILYLFSSEILSRFSVDVFC